MPSTVELLRLRKIPCPKIVPFISYRFLSVLYSWMDYLYLTAPRMETILFTHNTGQRKERRAVPLHWSLHGYSGLR